MTVASPEPMLTEFRLVAKRRWLERFVWVKEVQLNDGH